MVVAGEHRSLPHLAFLDLAIAQQAERTIRIAPVLGGERHAHRGGDALTQRASGHVDAGSVVHVGMALQVATNMAQGLKIIFGEEPALGEHGIQGRGAVTLGEDEPVAIHAARVARVDVHLLKIQIRDDIG